MDDIGIKNRLRLLTVISNKEFAAGLLKNDGSGVPNTNQTTRPVRKSDEINISNFTFLFRPRSNLFIIAL